MSDKWQIRFGPCTIIPHPIRNGILLVTKTEAIAGEITIHPPPSPITEEMVQAVIDRHGEEFLKLISSFQEFVSGIVTLDHDGDSFSVVRCYEINLVQRTILLKYLANEIALRACAITTGEYPDQQEFKKPKG